MKIAALVYHLAMEKIKAGQSLKYESGSSSRHNKVLKLRLMMNSMKEVAAAIGITGSAISQKICEVRRLRRFFGNYTLDFRDGNLQVKEKKQAADILEGVWVHYGPGNDEDEQFLGYSYPEQTDKLTRL